MLLQVYQRKRTLFIFSFIAYLFFEIATFIFIGRELGILGTLGLIASFMIIGILLIRNQSLTIFSKLSKDLHNKQADHAEYKHNLFLLLSGFLFIIPSFITSFIAIALFFGPIQTIGLNWLLTCFSVEKEEETVDASIIDLDENNYNSTIKEKPPLNFDEYI